MSQARLLANLIDTSGDVVSSALGNVPASNNASALTTGTLDIDIFPAGSILQCYEHKTNSVFGGSIGFNNNPDSTHGSQLTSFNFTPLKSNSTLMITSSVITIYETSNEGDTGFAAAWVGTTKFALNYAPVRYSSFGSAFNAAYICLNGRMPSWGTTQSTVSIRVGMSGSNVQVNHDSSYYSQHGGINGNNYIHFNVWEIA